MAYLHVKFEDGNLLLVTDKGEVIEADSVVIRLFKGQPAKIATESKTGVSKNARYARFYANAATGKPK